MPIKEDKYANLMQFTAVESAANTLTFGSIDLGLTIFQKVGIIINRIVVEWSNSLIADMDADGDHCQVAITQSNSLASLSITENAVVWKAKLYMKSQTGVGFQLVPAMVETFDFASLPGGGELIAPRPLYWGILGGGLGTVQPITVRMYFSIIELKAEEYFEILESRRFFG